LSNVKNETHHHQHNNTFNITQQPLKVVNQIVPVDKNKDPRAKVTPYRNFVRSVGNVKIYETNAKEYMGSYLRNPSEYDLENAIKRAQRGGMNHIYILRD
jgi:hypothetical protein